MNVGIPFGSSRVQINTSLYFFFQTLIVSCLMANGDLESIFMYLEISREPRLTNSKLFFGGDDQPIIFFPV